MAVPSQCDRAGLQGFVVGLDMIHWLSSGLASFARGTNDAPKIVAMLLLGSATAVWPSTSFQLAAFGESPGNGARQLFRWTPRHGSAR